MENVLLALLLHLDHNNITAAILYALCEKSV